MSTMREKIGSEIAYKIDWCTALSIPIVYRCGGTVWLEKKGKKYKVTVEEVND